MTALPTLLIVGFAIGLFAATCIVAYRIRRPIYNRQLEAQIPEWVNQAGPPKVIRVQDLIDELNFDLWESELEETDR